MKNLKDYVVEENLFKAKMKLSMIYGKINIQWSWFTRYRKSFVIAFVEETQEFKHWTVNLKLYKGISC